MNSEPTRLLVKNLSPSVEDRHLRKHVEGCPPIAPVLTDVKVLKKADGTSRRLGFLGFKSHRDAQRVLDWLQRSWVQGERGGSLVKVDWARETNGDPSRQLRTRTLPVVTADTSRTSYLDAQDRQVAGPSTKKTLRDPRLQDFMSVMAPRRNRALEDDNEPQADLFARSLPASIGAGSSSPSLVSEATPSTKRTQLESSTEGALQANNHLSGDDRWKQDEPHREDVPDQIANDETISDLDYMTRRMKGSLESADIAGSQKTQWLQDDDPNDVDESHPADPSRKNTEKSSEEEDREEQLLLEYGRIFIRNLPFSITEPELRDLLEPFGELLELHVPIDRSTQNSKGLAYATFEAVACAVKAYRELDGRSFQGRLLHLIPATKPRAESSVSETSTLRHERLDARKQASTSAISWATLYMNSDAVMSSIADRLGVSKATLLDPTADNAAVRVALAETHAISETKKYFEAEGVNTSALSDRGSRSKTTILVKNLPYGTTASILMALFSPFGTVSRMLIPPSGSIAIVKMDDAASASSAWRGLAYKKLGSSLLYLEKGPARLWTTTSDSTASEPTLRPTEGDYRLGRAQDSNGASAPKGTTDTLTGYDEAVDGATLFVKNLAFVTTNHALRSAFEHLPDFLFARVQTKPDPIAAGQLLSMGFGFVGFRTHEAAKNASEVRNGFILDGHKLEIRFAHRGNESQLSTKKREASSNLLPSKTSASTTKLIVKNVPFEATRQDIRGLFSAYGQLKSVRLPRKIDHKTRGFAFLDFATRRDAEAAFAALEHTHLLGRHLVLQWAEHDETDVEALRTRSSLSTGTSRAKKAKFEI